MGKDVEQQEMTLPHSTEAEEAVLAGVMRGDSVAGMWPTLEVVRDIYSNASVGVVLTWIALWDAAVAFRASAYRRAAFQIAA